MTSEPLAPGAPAIYLYRQIEQDDRAGRQTNFIRIKVFTEEGRKHADVEIPFWKDWGRVRDIKARTRQPDGSVVEFNGTVYEKTIVKAKGVKVLAKTFTLPDVRPGTIVEYSYTLDGWGYQSSWILTADLFTKKAKFSLKPSSSLGLRWTYPVGLPPGTNPPSQTKEVVTMEAQNVAAMQVEDFMPPENTVKYRVEFIYSWGFPETDEKKFWQHEVAGWFSAFDSFAGKPKVMEKAVAEIVSPADSPETKLQKIYLRVHQVRNLTYERDKTDKEEKREHLKDLHSVEDVWKRGYGGARAINWLYVALAKAAGFDACPVLVPSRDTHFFNQKLFNARQLDREAVLVKLQGKDLFLNPGSPYAPFGLLPWYETMVPGLTVEKDGGRWVQTPTSDSASARVERKAQLTLSEEGDLEGKLTVTFGGLEALELRTDERDDDDTARKADLENIVKESIAVGAEVELTNQPDWNSASPVLVAEYRIKVRGWGAAAGRRTLFPMGLFGNTEKHLFEHANRTYAIYFHHPFLKVDEINVSLPAGWKVANLPNPVNQDAKAVAFVLKAEDSKGSLHISRTLRSDLGLVSQSQYGILRQFFQIVRTKDEQQVVLEPTS